MKKVIIEIDSPEGVERIDLDNEVSIGRTELADVVIDDPGLSRINTTVFRDNEDILVVDEGSSNGTFLNGDRIEGAPRRLFDGDELKIGLDTRVRIEIDDPFASRTPERSKEAEQPSASEPPPPKPKPKPKAPATTDAFRSPEMMLYIGLASIFVIIVGAVILLALFSNGDDSSTASAKTCLDADPQALIPCRLQDPFGGQKQEDIGELVQYFEVQDEIDVKDLNDVSGSDTGTSFEENFNVTVEFFKRMRAKALEKRDGPTGNDPPGQKVPKELHGDGVIKQKAKLREMLQGGYVQPMDYADLAKKRMSGELVELPMATEYWVLEVGSSANEAEFTSFDFGEHNSFPTINPAWPDYGTLSQLAANFSGQRYELTSGTDRKQMKQRLLRMFHPTARPILVGLAKAYHAKFNRPLRVTSLSRSMEYQILLNRTNANSFKVRGKGSLPPHTSGCAFDLARKHMTAEEQNFVMAELARLENEGKLDALREGNVNACFHVFIYPDGIPPKM
ncbi:MAG: FHA domain-containing protein [Acidobacteria bacterium]|nr:MAG: FHA domain-containing protein [Acidobacteriota bacterium]REK02996.1 MAG: FHA domain-containing protein [Acidobacteriota bacterium]REK13200.1 MAG: FHA domain-containing protein [Acidobacteriota bacterium]REK41194.1 MAG: FHA domain-containing protein [Acidobacteriota bacterium]